MNEEELLAPLTVGLSANTVSFLVLDDAPMYVQYPLMAVGTAVVLYAGYHLVELDDGAQSEASE